jgi:hypothetical protein
MKGEVERLGREKKDLAERLREAENQLEWVRSERDEEIAKLAGEKKSFQDRLRESDSQLAQLQSRKRDELKVGFCLWILIQPFSSVPCGFPRVYICHCRF